MYSNIYIMVPFMWEKSRIIIVCMERDPGKLHKVIVFLESS